MGALRIVSAVLGAAAAPPEPAYFPESDEYGPVQEDERTLHAADLVSAFPAQAASAAFLDAFISEAKERARSASVAGARWSH